MSADTTRDRVLGLIVTAGPITAAELADKLSLTSAAVRRHLGALTDEGLIAERDLPGNLDRGRGRPARSFVATPHGQNALASAYADVATGAIAYLRAKGELGEFVASHEAELVAKFAPVVSPFDSLSDKVDALAAALGENGYATSVRPGPGGYTVQLCQGHCPVQAVAEVTPEWCEAETRAFSHLLDAHVQRLSTLAQGAHVCTTTIPLTPALKEG